VGRLLRAARVVHPFPSILVAATAVALAAIADADAPPSRYLAVGLPMLLFQFTIGAANDVIDFESDRHARPGKPLVAGLLSRRAAALVAGVSCVAGLGIMAILSWEAWLLGAACLSCGLIYDFWLKRTLFSWAPYAVAFSLLPVWVFVASSAWSGMLWWVFPIGVTLGFALHLANQAPDVEMAGNDFLGLPALIGSTRSDTIAIAGFIGAAGLAALVLWQIGAIAQAWLAAALGVAMIAASPVARRSAWRTTLFALLATAAAALAIVFLSAA
jgi:4-hydroxybenzoate polyprenyltransferase